MQTVDQAIARADKLRRLRQLRAQVELFTDRSRDRYQAAMTGTDPCRARELNAALRHAWGLTP